MSDTSNNVIKKGYKMIFPINITKKIQINFHKKIGLKPSYTINKDNYGVGIVYSLRFNWSTISLTILK